MTFSNDQELTLPQNVRKIPPNQIGLGSVPIVIQSIKPRVKTLQPQLSTRTATTRITGSRLQAIRAEQFKREPLCRMCAAEDPPRYVAPTVVDHIDPLWNGGPDTWANRQSLCYACHDVKSAREAKLRAGSASAD